MVPRSLCQPVLALIVAGLALGGAPVTCWAGPLDAKYSKAQVEKWLNDEIADIYEQYDPDEDYADEALIAAILDALADAPHAGMSDRHRQAHQYLHYGDLVAEMKEAGTTLQEVVTDAVYEADAISLTDPDDGRTIMAAWADRDMGKARSRHADLRIAQQGNLSGRNGQAKPRTAGQLAARDTANVAFGSR